MEWGDRMHSVIFQCVNECKVYNGYAGRGMRGTSHMRGTRGSKVIRGTMGTRYMRGMRGIRVQGVERVCSF